MARMIQVGSRTPWGKADHIQTYANGIVFASTPSHGGYKVPAALNKTIDPAYRAYAKLWSGSESWYEEDIAYQAIHLSFPDIFPHSEEERESFRATLSKYMKEYGLTPAVNSFEALGRTLGTSKPNTRLW